MHVNDGVVEEPPPPSTAVVGVIGSKQGAGLASDLSLLRVSATTHALHQALGALISQVPAMKRLPTTIKIWIPEVVVRRALPQMCKLLGNGAGGPSTQALAGSSKRRIKESGHPDPPAKRRRSTKGVHHPHLQAGLNDAKADVVYPLQAVQVVHHHLGYIELMDSSDDDDDELIIIE
jgi:hypothetical protein